MTAMASSPLTPKDPKSVPPPPSSRRKNRSTSSASTTTTSSSSSASSSILSTPSPSRFVIQTPFHCSSSSVPFSWEQTPGIPKTPSKTLQSHQAPRLPLPPPLRSDSFSRKKSTSSGGGDKRTDDDNVDPFAVALAECAKDPPAESDIRIGGRSEAKAKGFRRFSFGDMFGFRFGRLDLHGSCKTSCPVSESTVGISRAGSHRIINRRIG